MKNRRNDVLIDIFPEQGLETTACGPIPSLYHFWNKAILAGVYLVMDDSAPQCHRGAEDSMVPKDPKESLSDPLQKILQILAKRNLRLFWNNQPSFFPSSCDFIIKRCHKYYVSKPILCILGIKAHDIIFAFFFLIFQAILLPISFFLNHFLKINFVHIYSIFISMINITASILLYY